MEEKKGPSLRAINQIVSLYPSDEEKRVDELIVEEKYEEAKTYIEQMLGEKKDPFEVEPLVACRGDILRLTGQPEEARKDYQTILDNEDARPCARHRSMQGLSRLLMDEGKPSEAIPILEKAIEKYRYAKEPFEKLLEEAKGMQGE